MLKIRSLDVAYGGLTALEGVDLDVEEGQFVAVVGPTGCGKSTLLHLCGAMDRPTSGRVRLEGQALDALTDDALTRLRRARIGFVFQQFNLLARTTAVEQVELPLLYAGAPNRRKRALEALERVQLADRWHHRPTELSGGQQQRVAIERAVVKRPDVLLCDEPTGALDYETGKLVLDALHRANRELGTLTVVITHNAAIAGMADRVVRLSDGQVVAIEQNAHKQDVHALQW